MNEWAKKTEEYNFKILNGTRGCGRQKAEEGTEREESEMFLGKK
jgi:hypothetical protein